MVLLGLAVVANAVVLGLGVVVVVADVVVL